MTTNNNNQEDNYRLKTLLTLFLTDYIVDTVPFDKMGLNLDLDYWACPAFDIFDRINFFRIDKARSLIGSPHCLFTLVSLVFSIQKESQIFITK